ncbi:MAG: hypothetical protein PHP93_01550 [Kiritimatiellales bacterium]|nr:hypothetical protein [Kiritimatiellales bacterium]
MAIVNIIPGILLSWFYKPIGTYMSNCGKKLHLDKLLNAKLYEEHHSRKFILVVGIWLITWGLIAFFLLPAIMGKNS